MENDELERIPPEMFVRACLEGAQSALRQNLPLPEYVLRFDSLQGRMLSDLLDMIDAELSDEDFDNCVKAIVEVVAYDAKAVNVLAQTLLKLQRLFKEDRSQFSIPKDFKGKVKEAYEVENELRSRNENFDSIFDEIIKEPITGLFKQLYFVISEERLHRRYLRSRFGMKQKLLRRLIFKQTRAAAFERNNFQSWWRRNGRPDSTYTRSEIETALGEWRDQLSHEKALFHYAQERFVRGHTLQTIWTNTIFISFASLHHKHGGPGFPLEELCFDILQRIKPALKDFSPIMQMSALQLKQEFSLDYEDELVKLTVWAARNINVELNKRAAKALKADGRPIQETKLERIPANILVALAEEPRSKTNRSRSILSRVSEMLGDDLLLDAKHEALRLDRLRKAAREDETVGAPAEGQSNNPILKPEDLAESHAEDFTLREEARIDLENIIRRASLTPSEWEVLELDIHGLTDKEIAQSLGKPAGTVKPLLFKARKKLRKAVNRS